MKRFDGDDLASAIFLFLFFGQVLVLVLKVVGILKCTWFVVLLPLIAFLGLMVLVTLVMVFIILLDKDSKVE